MKNILNYIAIVLLFLSFSSNAQNNNRAIILTDIENEPDDAESMVRLMLYSNNIDIEALIATTSTHLRDRTSEWRIEEIVTAYGKVRDNLLLHEKGYPTEQYLKSIIKKGIPKYGMEGVGPEMDSEGSEWIIQVVDRNDDRPVWVSVWGGVNCLAQALWKVQHTRSKAELDKFVSKLRVYTISDQDDSGYWIRKEFPGLFYIVSPGDNYLNDTWSGISGEPWYNFASGADTNIVRNPWLRENIINNHGPLGAEYPEVEYTMEGDTPSFLGLVQNGLNYPEIPSYGGWGGRYELYTPEYKPYHHLDKTPAETRPLWTDTKDAVLGKDGRIYLDNHATIWRWRDAYQNDFAARMDWCLASYDEANHPPVPVIDTKEEILVKTGEWFSISASGSEDPDGDALTYKWYWYPEAGDYWNLPWRKMEIEGSDATTFRFKYTDQHNLLKPGVTHLILEVTDNGSPALTRYRRIIVNIIP
ncbi:nucleoside hydrolase-like domain-containing protein [Bacteroidota bacterium]